MAKKTPAKKSGKAFRPSSRAADRVVPVGLTQFACVENPAENRKQQMALIEQAAKAGAKIVCTQEMFTSQYFCQVEDHRFFSLAESIPGPSTDACRKLARKYGIVIVASLFEKRASGLYHNTAAVIDADGSLMGVYRKMHIPDDPLYYEKFYFTPGDLGFRAWKTKHATIGVLICWDQWFPEGARLTAMQGAEILFYPTAIGWHPSEKKEYGEAQHDSWEVSMRAHAIANGCYVCAPNRVGHEFIAGPDGKPVNKDGIQFWGQSFAASPNGQVIHRAAIDKPQVMVVECDLNKVEFARTHWPFLRDRRIDAYGDMTKRFSV
ncbi:MAG: carbon-nitrogen hydrolase [Phycisphaerales bacterium]|nr:carbon-nitrogen hydrolase [Phycisphaerales bacterium]